MKFNNEYLKNINIERFAKYAIFDSCDIDPTALTKASKGIQCIGRLALEMLTQEIMPYAVSFSDLTDMIGISEREARRMIRTAIRVGHDEYDGTYGRPSIIEPEQAVYITAALTIQEYGRKASDLSEYIVRRNINEFLDIGAILSAYDMCCYVFLIEYFEHCLDFGKTPITKYIKDFGGVMVSTRRIKSFLERNYGYHDVDEVSEVVGMDVAAPRLSDVTNAIFDNLVELRDEEKRRYEKEQLDRAFDRNLSN